MLAHDVASRFEEWLAEQTRSRPWSLQRSLREWLSAEAAYWAYDSYELYLQAVVLIVARWADEPERFVYHHEDHGDAHIEELSREDDLEQDRSWECLRRDQFERAVFLQREDLTKTRVERFADCSES